jgi:PAS domain S-box-containing protein
MPDTTLVNTKTGLDNDRVEHAVLVIQDYPPAHLEMSTLLRQFGCEVLTAFDAEGAIELAVSRRLDLFVVDFGMTRMAAPELCRKMRARRDIENVPILLVGGDPVENDVLVAARKAGADDFLELPCEPAHLLARVVRLIERHRAVELLRKQDLSFKAMIESLPDRVTVVGEDGITLYENPAVEHQTGYKPDELMGRNNLALIHPDDRQRLMDAETGVLVEYRHRHKDGSWRLLESAGQRMVDESGKSVAIVITHDISGRSSVT